MASDYVSDTLTKALETHRESIQADLWGSSWGGGLSGSVTASCQMGTGTLCGVLSTWTFYAFKSKTKTTPNHPEAHPSALH